MLKVRHLSVNSKDYRHQLIDLSFEIQKSEIVAVVGPNNSGKSLLLRVIADPDIHFEGEVIVHHFASRTEPEKVKLQIGYVPPDITLEPHLTSFEYLELMASFYRLPSSAATERILLLARAFNCTEDLYSLLERQGRAFHQKTALISSLLHQPPLLVWDEPVLFLDEWGQEVALKELHNMVEQGSAALISLNDLALAEQLADRIIVIDEGQIVANGTIEQIKHMSGQSKSSISQAVETIISHE